MKTNVGTTDRIIRFTLAAVLAILYFTGVVSGTLGYIFLIASVAMLLTGIFKFCALYALLGIKTCKS